MAITLPQPRASSDDSALNAADAANHGGGTLATIISALAFLFSGLSYYESALKAADLEIHVPPVLQYGRDGGGDSDVFALPITIANGGSNTGTVLAFELGVERLKPSTETPNTKLFYSAFSGEHPRDSAAANKTFAPISIPGRGTFTDTIRFFPQGNPLPLIVQDAGEFKFTLTARIAQPVNPGWLEKWLQPRAPDALVFTRTLPFISQQHLGFRRGTISMHAADWKPTSSAAK
jgi:hypothetical protein